MSYYGSMLASAKTDELAIKNKLTQLGYKVKDATKEQDRLQDIDCIIEMCCTETGDPYDYHLSIKSQHSGEAYGEIYFELYQQVKPEHRVRLGYMPREAWVKSTYFVGKHDGYAILQGKTLKLFHRSTIEHYVDTVGFKHVKTLSRARKAQLLSLDSYPFSDAKCGYINNYAIEPWLEVQIDA